MAVRHLIVKLTANTDAMSTGLNRGQQQVGLFTKSVNMMGGAASAAFKSITGAIGGYASAFAAGAMIHTAVDRTVESFRELDELGDLSSRLVVDPSRLAGLQHAATLTGSSADTLAASIDRMNTNIGEAAFGGGPAAEALKRIRLDAKQLSEMRADQAFYLIADAIAEIPDPGQQAALAVKIFGKEGRELVSMLREGTEGLHAFQSAAETFGIAPSAEEVERIGHAADEIDRAREAFRGLGNDSAIALAEPIEMAADAAASIALQLGAGLDTMRGLANLKFGDGTAFAADITRASNRFGRAMLELTDMDDALDSAGKNAAQSIGSAADESERMADAQKRAVEALKGQVAAIDRALEKLPSAGVEGWLIGSGFRDVLTDELDKLKGLKVDVPAELQTAVGMIGMSDAEKLLRSLAGSANITVPEGLSVDAAMTSDDERLATIGRIVDIMTDGTAQVEKWASAFGEADRSVENMQRQLSGMSAEQWNLNKAIESGAPQDVIDRLQQAADLAKELKAQTTANELNKEFTSAADQLTMRFLDLQSLLESGKITSEVAQAAFKDDAKRLGVTGQKIDAPEIKRAGSQEAYSAILKYQESQVDKTPDWAAKMIEILGKIADSNREMAEQAPDEAENLF